MVINATFNNISVISWRQVSGGRNRRKPPTRKSAASLLKLVTNCNVRKVSSVHCNVGKVSSVHCNVGKVSSVHCNVRKVSSVHCNVRKVSSVHCNVRKVSSVHLNHYLFLLNLHVVPKYYNSHRDGQ